MTVTEQASFSGQLRRAFLLSALLLSAAVISVSPRPLVASEENLLPNGDVTEGSGHRVAYWRPLLEETPDAVSVGWVRGFHGAGELIVMNARPAAGGYQELVALRLPGWYRLSAEIDQRGVSEEGVGAQIGITRFSVFSVATTSVHDSGGWQQVELYFKVSRELHGAMVFCRLGARGRPSSGAARFRGLSLVRIDGSPPANTLCFDLDALDNVSSSAVARFIGSRWSVVLTFAVFATVAIGGWLVIGVL